MRRLVIALIFCLSILVTVLAIQNVSLRRQLADSETIVRMLGGELDTTQEENGALRMQARQLSTVYAPVFFVSETGSGYELVPELRAVTTSSDPGAVAASLLNELLKGPRSGSGLTSPIPKGTRLLSAKVKDGLAILDFSSEILSMHLGSPLEAAAVESIVKTVGSLSSVQRVQVLVGGETIPSIAGHIDLSRPLEVYPTNP